MIKSLAQELLAKKLVKRDDTIVVGVSGGPDSMALLHMLLALNQTMDWELKLHAAHLNHGLRADEGEKDAAFVQAAADSLSLPCTIDTRDIAAISKSQGVGIEEAGRIERYAFAERVCLKIGAKTVALGHHADDNAETILHRIIRGTGLRGLAGIPVCRPLTPESEIRIVRPLLRMSRQTLVNYLADQGIAYREDRTNERNEPTRNRIRNVVLPLLESDVNPQVRDALARLGEQAQWMEEYLRDTVQRTLNTLLISRTDQTLSLNVDGLARKSRVIQTEIVRAAYRSFGLGEQSLAFSHLTAALDLISDSSSGKRLQLPGGMVVEKRYHLLIFSVPTDEPRELIASEVAIHLPGRTLLPVRRLEIQCHISDVVASEIPRLRRSAEKLNEYVDLESIHPPLVVRTRKPGDRFLPLGAPGSKKLSDFLIDAKVDPQERDRIAVLCDQLGPIWIIGHRIDDRVKMTALTKRVLQLRAQSLEL